MNKNSKKDTVVVIGLDGATFDLIIPWINAGELPNIKKIMFDGVYGDLLSTIPPLSPQAWTSFMTGKNPGKHGIFDFTDFKPGSYELQFSNANLRRSKSLWKILSEAGRTVGVVNVPMCYPPEEVNGFLIAGMEAPGTDSVFTYPPDLYQRIKAATGEEYDIHGDYWTDKTPEEYLQQVLETMDNQAGAIKYLLKSHNLDFFMAVFGSTDRIQHFYWKYIDSTHPGYTEEEAGKFGKAILEVYRKADEIIGDYLSLIDGQKTVFLMSDHGAGPLKKIIYLDKWLQQKGLLNYKKEASFSVSRIFFNVLKSVYLSFRKYFPRKAKHALKALFPDLREKVETHLIVSKIDWDKTRAFSIGVESTPVFINLEGKFPHGVVKADEYDGLRDLIIKELSMLTDPDTGEPVLGRVYKKEEIYHGSQLQRAPDLIISWRNLEYVSRRCYGNESSEIISSILKAGVMGKLMSLESTGCHRMNGIMAASGKHIAGKGKIGLYNIMDLAPTILYRMGIPVPKDMDGKVLTEIFNKEFTKKNEVQYTSHSETDLTGRTSDYMDQEEEDIKKRLRSLGYLE